MIGTFNMQTKEFYNRKKYIFQKIYLPLCTRIKYVLAKHKRDRHGKNKDKEGGIKNWTKCDCGFKSQPLERIFAAAVVGEKLIN